MAQIDTDIPASLIIENLSSRIAALAQELAIKDAALTSLSNEVGTLREQVQRMSEEAAEHDDQKEASDG